MSKEGGIDAPIRHPINFEHPDFLDPKKLDDEMRRAFDIFNCTEVVHTYHPGGPRRKGSAAL